MASSRDKERRAIASSRAPGGGAVGAALGVVVALSAVAFLVFCGVALNELEYASDHPFAYGPAKVIASCAGAGALVSVSLAVLGGALLRLRQEALAADVEHRRQAEVREAQVSTAGLPVLEMETTFRRIVREGLPDAGEVIFRVTNHGPGSACDITVGVHTRSGGTAVVEGRSIPAIESNQCESVEAPVISGFVGPLRRTTRTSSPFRPYGYFFDSDGHHHRIQQAGALARHADLGEDGHRAL
jgi:hypothetical protein